MDITQGAPFESFGLSEATMRAIHNKGYEVHPPHAGGEGRDRQGPYRHR